MKSIDIALLGATEAEIAPLFQFLPVSGRTGIGACPFMLCEYRGLRILAGTTGIGKVNAAAVTSAVICSFNAGEVWNAGCAGSYGGSGLDVGDVLISTDCVCGDEGVLDSRAAHPMSTIGIPLLKKKGFPLFDGFPLEEFLQRRKIATLLPEGRYTAAGDGSRTLRPCLPGADGDECFSLRYGSSLTVGMASGDRQTASARFRTHGALAENMEGSAMAQSCALFNVPFLEIRGVSNIAGERERGLWNIPRAVRNSIRVVYHLLARS
ncbi:MAG: hypothetical protein LLG06_17250 [Desulfobacteraceae bacterium]|nr:hypothetical protein [Desulfobacteraceae bacterium]